MYGLFHCTYDYYEWMDLICVADTKEALVKHCETTPITDETTHKGMVDKERQHFYIISIDKID